MPMKVRRAVESDAPALVAMINRAFEVERFFIGGDRIDLGEVRKRLGRGEFLIAHGVDPTNAAHGGHGSHGSDNAGCVYLEPRGERCYLGLLSVNPDLQGTGLGRGLMQAAEQRARELRCDFMDILVVNLREELPPFYRRLGYVDAGTSDFTPSVQTLLPCHFLKMSKRL